jgi:hypothetical protein
MEPTQDDLAGIFEERQLTEEQRTEAVKALLAQGFSVADIWKLAPRLLTASPGRSPMFRLPVS